MRSSRRNFLIGAMALSASTARAQSSKALHVTGARPTIFYAPLIATVTQGFLKKHGVEADFHWLGSTPLVEGLRNDVITTDQRIREWIPVPPLTFAVAVARALAEEHAGPLATRWTGAAATSAIAASWTGPVVGDEQRRAAAVPAATLFATVERIGGATGWYYGDWLWRLRGLLDRLLGGVGMRRGRRDPVAIALGDPIDFWRVEDFVPGRLLRLRAEMKVPGAATLEFAVEDQAGGGAILAQRARFQPRGVWGRAYWHALRPRHLLVFRGMADGIVRAAEAGAATRPIA